jgi:hypothetical protein
VGSTSHLENAILQKIRALASTLKFAHHMPSEGVQHLYANFRNDSYREGGLPIDMLWKAASSYTQNDFYAAMEELKGLN